MTLPARIQQHEPATNAEICLYCAAPISQWQSKTCIFRDAPPRAIPKPIFSDLDGIYNRIQELQKEREENFKGTDAKFGMSNLIINR